MRAGLAILLVVLLIGLICIGFYYGNYNAFVRLEEEIDANWAQVENILQRRYDLIPNLVETVKGYAKHEKEVFENIADARARMAGASSVSDRAEASGRLESALSRLMVLVENYPQLKADQQFLRLQDELSGTENRLAVERMRYNEAVKKYNQKVRMFPSNIVAKWMGLSQRNYFEVAEEAKDAPKVEF